VTRTDVFQISIATCLCFLILEVLIWWLVSYICREREPEPKPPIPDPPSSYHQLSIAARMLEAGLRPALAIPVGNAVVEYSRKEQNIRAFLVSRQGTIAQLKDIVDGKTIFVSYFDSVPINTFNGTEFIIRYYILHDEKLDENS